MSSKIIFFCHFQLHRGSFDHFHGKKRSLSRFFKDYLELCRCCFGSFWAFNVGFLGQFLAEMLINDVHDQSIRSNVGPLRG